MSLWGWPGCCDPKKPNPVKTDTYECGLQTIGDTWVQFRAQYYIYALVFVVFDIEAVFLFPWAVAYDKVGTLGAGSRLFSSWPF